MKRKGSRTLLVFVRNVHFRRLDNAGQSRLLSMRWGFWTLRETTKLICRTKRHSNRETEICAGVEIAAATTDAGE
jgi:hypothetical protein